MWFWVAAGVVVAAVVMLGWVAGVLRRALAELHRVADLATERTGLAQRRVGLKAEQVRRAAAALEQDLARTKAHASATGPRLAAPRRRCATTAVAGPGEAAVQT